MPSTPSHPAPSAHEILFPALPFDLSPRADTAVADVQLQQFLARATLTKEEQRRSGFEATFGSRVDAVRELAGQIRQHALDHLDYYLNQFIDRASANGAVVHLAADAAEACRIGVALARQRQCKLCVKAKSMVTEEIQVVPALIAAGVETVETDLAEFILQLDGDAPSHIVTPLIHKDRASVGRTFAAKLGVPYTDDPRQLTMIARAYLRDKFRKADLGISGANFLIAETGSVVVCTNEGNGRLSTSAPPVHIVFAGIEKVVPRLEHLGVLLKVLARGSTGQPLTVYTHLITGPRRPSEHDGPGELHIVLIDNGRTGLLAPETRPMLRCIRCGACLNTCPVYRKIGGHAYGSVYCGPIGAIITPLLRGLANYPDLPNASTLCGACAVACPVKIDIPHHLVQLRRGMVETKVASRMERWTYRLWAWSLGRVWSYRLGAWAQRRVLRLLAWREGTLRRDAEAIDNRGWLTHAPGPMKAWTDQRDLPTPTAQSFRQWWRNKR